MIKTIDDKPEVLSGSSADFWLAAAVAWFGLKLRDSKLVPDKAREHILQLAQEGNVDDKEGYKAGFIRLVEAVE